ncbi:MAG: hypothetical protein ACRC37_00450, partial [Lentisphaeria bacterium]
MRISFIVGLFITFSLSAADFKLNKFESLPQMGIKIKIPRKANIIPISPYTSVTMYREDSSGRTNFKAVEPYKYWR